MRTDGRPAASAVPSATGVVSMPRSRARSAARRYRSIGSPSVIPLMFARTADVDEGQPPDAPACRPEGLRYERPPQSSEIAVAQAFRPARPVRMLHRLTTDVLEGSCLEHL